MIERAMAVRLNGETVRVGGNSDMAEGIRTGMQEAELRRQERENERLRKELKHTQERLRLYCWALNNERERRLEAEAQLNRKRRRVIYRMIAVLGGRRA